MNFFKCACICMVVFLLSSCHGNIKVENPANAEIIAYCRDLDYSDTATLHSDKAMAKVMYDFVMHMKAAHPDAIVQALEIFANGIKDDEPSLRSASRHAYRLLANPNSPLRSERQYIAYLEAIANTPGIPVDFAETTKEKLRKARLNRIGTIANDFRYIDRYGKESSLHQLKGEHIMLVFYDPECPHCTELLRKKASSRRVNAAIGKGELTVLAVYAEGKRDIWDKTKHDMPKNWIVAYDLTGVLDNELYDLPAMPIAYSLSADKRVIDKDVPW